MAYLSHSPYSAYKTIHRRGGAMVASMPIVVKSALVATAAAAVILGFSGAASKPSQPVVAAAAKSDRLATLSSPAERVQAASQAFGAGGVEIRRDRDGRIVYMNDPAAQTTTVARGATAPLSPSSPFGPDAK